jgi:hypothetical protein
MLRDCAMPWRSGVQCVISPTSYGDIDPTDKQRIMPTHTPAFETAASSNRSVIKSTLLTIVLREIGDRSPGSIRAGSLDATFTKLSMQMAESAGCAAEAIVSVRSMLDRSVAGEEPKDACRACGQGVALGENGVASCPNGHEWCRLTNISLSGSLRHPVSVLTLTTSARCSITHLLITTPTYRICSSCKSIALLPDRILRPPIAVTRQGISQDSQRYASDDDDDDADPSMRAKRGDRIVQSVLEACVICPTCGGRWMRAI